MLFNSLQYLFFLPIVIITYFLIPHKYRWILLLGSSYYFYMVWRPIYVVLIIFSTLIDYYVSIKMDNTNSNNHRKLYLIISLITNLGMLFIFKYLGFFTEILNGLTENNYDVIYLILPMGISFYTFQTLSYTLDVYRRDRTAEKHFGYFALYVTFFPQLVAGPIERSTRLIPQLKREYGFDYLRTLEGVHRISLGFLKKVIIADNLAVAVNHVYANIEYMSGLTILIATIFFAVQIYCDFSGYSDIAIGTSKIFGIELIENFNQPYLSKSINEFWSRWHISLSTWFRDYIYIPLGGSRKGILRTNLNILTIFFISGLWHGASWMFVIWGLIHGFFSVYERLTLKFRDKLWNVTRLEGSVIQYSVKWLFTMSIVLFSWIFFRSENLESAFFIIKLIGMEIIEFRIFSNIIYSVAMTQINDLRLLVVVIIVIFSLYLESKTRKKVRMLLEISVIFWLIMFFGSFGLEEFIYFQF